MNPFLIHSFLYHIHDNNNPKFPKHHCCVIVYNSCLSPASHIHYLSPHSVSPDPIRSKFHSLTNHTHSSLRRGIHYAGNTKSKTYDQKRRFPFSIPVTTSYEHDSSTADEAVDDIPVELIFHFCWQYLSPQDIASLTNAAPILQAYRALRKRALAMHPSTLLNLLTPLNPEDTPTIDKSRVDNLSQLLLLSHFDFSILAKLLRGPLVADYLDFQHIDNVLDELEGCPSHSGEPVHDFEKIRHQLLRSSPFLLARLMYSLL